MSKVTISADEMRTFVERVCLAAGFPRDESAFLVESLLDAELRGMVTHGLLRLPVYLERVWAGGTTIPTVIELVQDNGASAVLDANNGLGQTAALQGMELAVNKAKQFAVGVVAIRNSSHFGTAGFYARKAAQAECVGVVMTNASSRLPPWGGKEPLLGNNPWAIAFPTDKRDRPFVLDIANSVAAAGKIRQAAKQGKSIPEGWALNAEGKATIDPLAALQGILLPMAGHKGYGITLAVGLLSSLLSDGIWDEEVGPIDNLSRRQQVSHLLLAISICHFVPPDRFRQRAGEAMNRLKHSGKASGFEQILYPGEGGSERYERSNRTGIVLEPHVLQQLQDLATKLSVPFPKIKE